MNASSTSPGALAPVEAGATTLGPSTLSVRAAGPWRFNTSTRLRLTFSVPSGPNTVQHCRFDLDDDSDFADWVEQLAYALHQAQAALIPLPANAPSVQELIDGTDEATAQTLADLGLLHREPGVPRWRWRAGVILQLTTRTREAGEPLWEAHWRLPYIARILSWVRQQRSSTPSIGSDADDSLELKLQRAKLLIRAVPPDVSFERCSASEQGPASASTWHLHPQHWLEGSTLWVREPATGIRLPTQLESEEQSLLVAASSGERPLEALPAPLLAKLWHAGVLRQAQADGTRAARWVEEKRAGTRQLAGLGQATLRGILGVPELSRWSNYCRELFQAGYFPPMTTAGSGPLRSIIYAEQGIRLLHEPLARLLGEVAGEPLEPSYCILARYFEGATLPRHTDRPQCVWNFSLVLHWESVEDAPSPWPFFVEGPGGVVSEVLLRPGDGVLYRGTESPHWREALPPGNATTVAFFHFVPPHFKGHRT